MTRYIRIEQGIAVEDVTLPSGVTIGDVFDTDALQWVQATDSARTGDGYENGVFTRAPVREPLPPVAPSTVSMRQARLALLTAGKLQAVQDAIDSLPSPQREAASIEWEYAQTVDRGSDFAQSMASALGLDEAALDALFLQAATL